MTMTGDFFSNTLDYLQTGGSVIVPLVIISFWMWYLIIIKLRQFSSFSNVKKLVIRQNNRLRNEECEEGNLFNSILNEFQRLRTFTPATDKRIVKNLLRKKHSLADSHIQTILILAAAAPLLGLLGTVSGMIKTFDVISYFGTGNAKALAGGISEALISTQFGLIVAIPGLFMGNFLKRRAERMQVIFEQFGLQIEKTIYEYEKR